jgi:hypothetical protein
MVYLVASQIQAVAHGKEKSPPPQSLHKPAASPPKQDSQKKSTIQKSPTAGKKNSQNHAQPTQHKSAPPPKSSPNQEAISPKKPPQQPKEPNHISTPKPSTSRLDIPYFEIATGCTFIESGSLYSDVVSLSNQDSKFFGRLGNILISFENMIYESIASNCLIHLPPRVSGLPFYTPSCNIFNATQKSSPRSKTCMHGTLENFFYLSKTSNGKSIVEMRSSYGAVVDSLLKTYMTINDTHAYGMACPSESIFSIHIRSGDITRGTYNKKSGHYEPGHVHEKYSPFPTSYYAHVLRHALQSNVDRIIIFCENLSNPGCSAFETFIVTLPRAEMSVGTSLQNDLKLLSCSNEVAISAGTFFKAFTMRRKHIHTFEYLSLHTDGLDCSTINFLWFEEVMRIGTNLTKYFMIDKKQASDFERETNVWKNNEYQRALINKDFKMNSTTCST